MIQVVEVLVVIIVLFWLPVAICAFLAFLWRAIRWGVVGDDLVDRRNWWA